MAGHDLILGHLVTIQISPISISSHPVPNPDEYIFIIFLGNIPGGVPGSYAVSAFRLSRNDKNCLFSKVALTFLSPGVYGGFCLGVSAFASLSSVAIVSVSDLVHLISFECILALICIPLITTLGENLTCLLAM